MAVVQGDTSTEPPLPDKATHTNLSHVRCRQGDVHQALIVLQKGVTQCFPDDQQLTDGRSLDTKGKAMLLVGRFMEETANFESNAIMKAYKVIMPLIVKPRQTS